MRLRVVFISFAARIYIWLKYKSPYVRAKIHLAYRKYEATTMYRARLIAMGEDFARNSFFHYREYRFFLRKLTRKEKLKAFFLPYSCIGERIF